MNWNRHFLSPSRVLFYQLQTTLIVYELPLYCFSALRFSNENLSCTYQLSLNFTTWADPKVEIIPTVTEGEPKKCHGVRILVALSESFFWQCNRQFDRQCNGPSYTSRIQEPLCNTPHKMEHAGIAHGTTVGLPVPFYQPCYLAHRHPFLRLIRDVNL